MRNFDRIIGFLQRLWPLSSAMIMVIVVSAFFHSSPASERTSGVFSPLSLRQQLPLSTPEETSDRKSGNLQEAIPAGGSPVIISRRCQNQISLRFVRDNTPTGMICPESAALIYGLYPEKQQKLQLFFFQNFLQHSLPPRAGPETV